MRCFQIMYAHDDPNILWVAPACDGKSTGTFEAPFTDINVAINKAKEGNTIVLMAGDYYDNVSVQNSGTITRPIRIVADNGAEGAVCCHSSWYFYDVSDLVVSGITYSHISHHAIAVIGACKRNSFTNLNFINCGIDNKAACTFFFGGSGAQCNVVEDCVFEIDQKHFSDNVIDTPIGLMISDGDTEDESEPNKNHVFRRNSFSYYGCAIVVGTHGTQVTSYSHIVEHNVIRYCQCDGIRVKCGDTIIRGNVITNCQKSGVSIVYGNLDSICNNRLIDCETGIFVAGIDCTITNNCIIRSTQQAISVSVKSNGDQHLHSNTIIELNTCVNNGKKSTADSKSSILLETDSNCVIRRNIFDGAGKPYIIHPGEESEKYEKRTQFIEDNIISGGCSPAEGCSEQYIEFVARKEDNYSNNSGYGASGWMAEGAAIPSRDLTETTQEYRSAILPHSSFFEGAGNKKELPARSLMPDAKNDTNTEDESVSENQADDGIIDFSDWDE